MASENSKDITGVENRRQLASDPTCCPVWSPAAGAPEASSIAAFKDSREGLRAPTESTMLLVD
jgi:hypothetical protein